MVDIFRKRKGERIMKKVLIVGTVPYNPFYTSRAFETYFNEWDKEKLAQVFSNKDKPIKGFYRTLYQITDEQMLKRWFKISRVTGVIYNESINNQSDVFVGNKKSNISQKVLRFLYSIGKRKTPIIYLLRGLLWKERYWKTERFNKWLDDFCPEVVFLSFSDDFFIPKIALYIANKFDIPIVSSIGDDYYFNYKFSISPFYHLYKLKYRKLIDQVLNYKGGTIYIGDKIRDKYNLEFKLNGTTVMLSSTIHPKEFKRIPNNNPVISYFGNIRLGRNESLYEIATQLYRINSNYAIDIYSSEKSNKYVKVLLKASNIRFHGSISYEDVQSKIAQSDILLIVEGFKKKDIDISRYSLSTKVADSIASGVNLFAYGSIECGAIEYLKNTGCVVTETHPESLQDTLRDFISNVELQQSMYNKTRDVAVENHDIKKNAKLFRNVIHDISQGDNKC